MLTSTGWLRSKASDKVLEVREEDQGGADRA
jgi:hypothetical protein